MVSEIVSESRTAIAEIIDINPAMIVLYRDVIVEDVSTTIHLDPQKMKISEINNSQTDTIMEQGVIPTHIVGITAFHDTDIIDGDRFTYLGRNYSVIFVRQSSFGGQSEDDVYKKSGRAKEINEAIE
jgi:hypothetical protein